MNWVRLWHDMPTDPKWRVVAKRSGRPLTEVLAVFTLMLTNAGANATERGTLDNWSDEDVAAALDMDAEHVTAIREAMQGKTLDGDTLTGWKKRQPKREDDSSERVKRYRDERRTVTQRNADETQRNAPEKRREDTDSEKKDTPVHSEQEAAPAKADGRTKIFDELKSVYNGTTDAMLAFIDETMGGNSRSNAEQWLASTTSAHGSSAVAQAFAALAEKRAAGEVIARPLPLWSSIAAGMKAGQAPKRQPAWAAEQEARRKAAREAVFGTGGTA